MKSLHPDDLGTFLTVETCPKIKIDDSNFEHSYWQRRISTHFDSECKTTEEKVVRFQYDDEKFKDKRIDVALEAESGIIAIEVAMTSAYEEENIIRDTAAGCLKVITACRNKKVLGIYP